MVLNEELVGLRLRVEQDVWDPELASSCRGYFVSVQLTGRPRTKLTKQEDDI